MSKKFSFHSENFLAMRIAFAISKVYKITRLDRNHTSCNHQYWIQNVEPHIGHIYDQSLPACNGIVQWQPHICRHPNCPMDRIRMVGSRHQRKCWKIRGRIAHNDVRSHLVGIGTAHPTLCIPVLHTLPVVVGFRARNNRTVYNRLWSRQAHYPRNRQHNVRSSSRLCDKYIVYIPQSRCHIFR